MSSVPPLLRLTALAALLGAPAAPLVAQEAAAAEAPVIVVPGRGTAEAESDGATVTHGVRTRDREAAHRVDRFAGDPVAGNTSAPLEARFPDDSSYWREGAIVGGTVAAIVVVIGIATSDCDDVEELCSLVTGPIVVASMALIGGGALVGGVIGAMIPRE